MIKRSITEKQKHNKKKKIIKFKLQIEKKAWLTKIKFSIQSKDQPFKQEERKCWSGENGKN